MTNIPSNPNPLYVANMAQQMAKQAEGAESRMFQHVAMISMVTMAVASASATIVALWRELNRKQEKEDRGRGR